MSKYLAILSEAVLRVRQISYPSFAIQKECRQTPAYPLSSDQAERAEWVASVDPLQYAPSALSAQSEVKLILTLKR